MTLDNWNTKWYGIWKEHGEGYENYPGIHLFVDESRVKTYNLEKLGEYLTQAPAVVVTSRLGFPNAFTGEVSGDSFALRTDGNWIWYDDLFDYIKYHNVAIPDRWYEEIKKADFKIDPSVEQNISNIDFASWML